MPSYPTIFDTHVHFPGNWQNPDEDPAQRVEHLMMRLREAGVVKAALLSGGRWGMDHATALRYLRPYEDRSKPATTQQP